MKRIKIGKRNIKTAISVFLALMVYIVLYLIDLKNGNTDPFSGYKGMYTPFFAGIAAAYTSHKDYKSSLKQARIRSVGSIIGGLFGMVIILIVEICFITLIPIENYVIYKLIEYTTVSLGIIVLIYLVVLSKQKDATFITCLTYLSVTISIRNGGMPIVQFAFNRILSTLIGVTIALVVNNFRIHYKRNKNVLFIANIDNTINYNDYSLSYTRYKINDLYQRDAKLVLHTKKSSLDKELFKDVHVNKPLVLMDGVCIYDDKTSNYIYSMDFDDETRIKLNHFISTEKLDAFTYVIYDLRLACHYVCLNSDAAKNYYQKHKDTNTYPFVYAPVLDDADVVMYELIIKKDDYEAILSKLNDLIDFSKIRTSSKNIDHDTYVKMVIKPRNSNRYETIKNLPYYEKFDYKISFVNHPLDMLANDISDFLICFDSADESLKSICNYIVKSNDFNDVLKLFNKIYHRMNVAKYLKKLEQKNKSHN